MYLYLASHKDGETVRLRYINVCRLIPMSRQGYNKSIKELKDKGYLAHIVNDNWLFGITPNRFAYEDVVAEIMSIFDEE